MAKKVEDLEIEVEELENKVEELESELSTVESQKDSAEDEVEDLTEKLGRVFTPDLFEVGTSDTSIAPVRLAAASLAEFLADWEEAGKKKTLGELRLLCRDVGRALLDAGEE